MRNRPPTRATNNNPPPAGLWDVLAVLTLLLLSVLVTLSAGDRTYDDAFITYRYARNLALGRGFVYNVGDPFLGTTTPLLTILLAFLGRLFSVDLIPQLSQWVSGLAIFLCALFAYGLARPHGKNVAGGVTALYLVLNPVFISFWGGEAFLLLALVLGGFVAYRQGRQALAGCLLALAFLARGEGVLAALVLGLHFVAVNRSFPWRGAIGFGSVMLPWIIYASATFGSPFPSTLQVKMAQMQSGYFSPFFTTSLRWLAAYVHPIPNLPRESSPVYLIVVLLAGVGGLALLKERSSPCWWLVAWVVLYVIGYSVLGVPFYHWYMAPLMLGTIALAGLGAQTAWERLAAKGKGDGVRHPAWRFLLVIVLVLPAVQAGKSLWDGGRRPVDPVQRLYTNAGLWLRDHTAPDRTVGYFEIGFIGFYGDRTMIDPVGLATPGASPHIVDGDFLWAFRRHAPDYLLINPVRWYDRIGHIRDEAWFDEAYHEVARIEEPGYFDSPLTIYRRMNAAAIPAPGQLGAR